MLGIIQQLVKRIPRQQPTITELRGEILFEQLVEISRQRPMHLALSQTQRITEPQLIDLWLKDFIRFLSVPLIP
ncbi:hypothetical protein PAERUG_P54_1_London_24_VIM_2_04_13_04823 [Pseudomonas aeruginosa]|nr:hypothetical protein PAERUG_E7_London_9_VIM_2_02_13_01989 [Pseudomonas aeruginosa]CRP19830.1 hypothetical protein PAERUG_P18_London_17_VIM_2_04_10_02840 [Pseudomonas aeruginosa]CRX28042.1 hypothetical protein PAERUG_P54_1_London_24_VIM_2_04_13_04823 [Pseudomonas aeruginosa]